MSGKSSRFFRKSTDEQTRHLLSLTKDLVQNNTIKKEVVWQRVVDDARALELGPFFFVITGNEEEAQIHKAKQRLTDKVRQEANKIKNNKVTTKKELTRINNTEKPKVASLLSAHELTASGTYPASTNRAYCYSKVL